METKMEQKELEKIKEQINYLREETELKIYEMFNGWLLMENEKNMGYNIVVPSTNTNVSENRKQLITEIGKWIVNGIDFVDENTNIQNFGWRIKTIIEPIPTDDFLLTTNLENEL